MAEIRIRTFLDSLRKVSVEPFIFLCLFSYVVRLASFQSLLMHRACLNIYNYGEDICNSLDKHTVEQANSITTGNNIYMAIMLLSSLPAAIVAIFLGPWSDKYSRKYPMIISASGILMECTAGAIITAFPETSPLCFVGVAVLSGLCGGFTVSSSSAFSYVADITDERSRPARYAVLEFSLIAGLVAANFVGGRLYSSYGYMAVMIASPCSSLCALLYAIFAVKETKPPIETDKLLEVGRDLFRCNNLRESVKTCTRQRPGNLRLQIWFLIWVSFSHKFVEYGTLSIEFPFTLNMYQWDVFTYTNAAIFYSIANAAVTVVLVPVLSKKLKLHEAALGAIGILSMMSKMVLFSVAYRAPFFYYAWVAGTMNNFATVAIKSRLSKLVTKGESGRAFSLLATCESLTPLLGAVAFIQVYNVSVLVFPGLPFAAAALFLIPSLLIFSWMMKMPTVSLAEFAITEDQTKYARPMETISSGYSKLQETNTS